MFLDYVLPAASIAQNADKGQKDKENYEAPPEAIFILPL